MRFIRGRTTPAMNTNVALLLADSFTVPLYFVVVMSKSAPRPASFSVKRS